MKAAVTAVAFSLCAVLPAAPACADEREDLEKLRQTTLTLIELLVEEGVLTKHKAELLMREADKRAAQAMAGKAPQAAAADKDKPGASTTVRVPYVPEVVKNEMREQIKQEVLAQAKAERWGDPGTLPEWLDRIKWEGDIRLRAAWDIFDKNNAPVTVYPQDSAGNFSINLPSTTDDRERLRVQARLGMLARVTDGVTAGFRITTGNTNEPVSTNQTLGAYGNKYQLVLDRAYLRADPYEWLTLSGGRMPNPWLSTDLVWDIDVNFDGVAFTLQPRFNPATSAFLTAGVFPLQESALSSADKWLYGGQVGLEWLGTRQRAKIGAAIYDFHNIEGRPQAAGSFGAPDYGFSAPQFRQRGNSLINIADPASGTVLFGLASKFRELNVTGVWDIASYDPVHVILSGDYVKNLAFDRNEIASRAGFPAAFAPEKKNLGYQARLTVGMPQLSRRYDWQLFGGYRYLGADAVVDAFTDSDFHAGGTNARGYFLGAGYGIATNTWLALRWMSSNEVSGPPLAVDTLFLDFNARF